MDQRSIITVDGLAGSGKTTLSQLLAEKLGYAHFNSGLLYRAVGFLALMDSVNPESPGDLVDMIARHKIAVRLDESKSSQILIDEVAYKSEVYTPEVTRATSISSQYAEVRSALVPAQRDAFAGHNIVAEGRDMGTVIFPTAAVKFFVEAAIPVRAERRVAQYKKSQPGISDEELNRLKKQVENDLIERDTRDVGRDVAPAKPAADAIIIDNSTLSLTQVVQNMYDAVLKSGIDT